MALRRDAGQHVITGATPPSRIEEAFAVALETPAEQREDLLRELLPDPEARTKVYRLLDRHAALAASEDGFLSRLDSGAAGALLQSIESTPETIGRYRVTRELARGGNGIVYLAHDPDLDRPVAIKVLRPERGLSASARDRLKTEARASSALDHPHIATIHEIGQTAGGDLFIVMAYYEGDTLRTRLTRGRLPVAEAERIGTELAGALAAAHARGIVHRDVKPENVMLTGSGVRLLDFGIATTASLADHLAGAAGTLAYMSPEQSRGDPPDPRSDVWALGVLLHEMLAGQRPFGGDDPAALLEAIRTAEPAPLRSLRPDVPEGLARIVRSCLDKDPARRPRGADAVQHLLNRPRGRRRATVAAVILLVTVLAGTVVVMARRPSVPTRSEPDAVAESLYVRGRALIESGTPTDLEQAAILFRAAIARDSTFARAYAGLARVIYDTRTDRPSDAYARIKPLLLRAMALDSSLSDVLTGLGWAMMWYDRDWVTSERYLRRALALDPTDPWKYHYYAGWLSAIGRIDEAVDLERRAMVVDPRGGATATHVALHLTRQKKYDEAITLLERVLKTDTTWSRTHLVLGRAYLTVGRYDEALQHLRRDNYQFAGFDPTAILAYALGVAGRRQEAHAITADFERRAREGYTNPINLMACYLGLGDVDRALDWAERIPDDRGVMFFAHSELMFEPLFQEPRFKAVLARLGLDSASVARLPDTRAAIDSILSPGGRQPGTPVVPGS